MSGDGARPRIAGFEIDLDAVRQLEGGEAAVETVRRVAEGQVLALHRIHRHRVRRILHDVLKFKRSCKVARTMVCRLCCISTQVSRCSELVTTASSR